MARHRRPDDPIQTYVEHAFARLESPHTRARRLPLTPWTPTTPWGKKRLTAHLGERYDVTVQRLVELVPGVFRLEVDDGKRWVARILPPARPLDDVAGDAAFLDFFEERGFSSERCAHAEPVSSVDGYPVLVTEWVDGRHFGHHDVTADNLRQVGSMLGALHAVPATDDPVSRSGGAWHGLSPAGGTRADDVETLLPLLAHARSVAPDDHQSAYGTISHELETIDLCQDLPNALVHIDLGGPNLLRTKTADLVAIDWTGVGRGPRVHSLNIVMAGQANLELVDAFIDGYRRHIELEPEELDRLGEGLRIHSLVLAAWSALFSGDRALRGVASIEAERTATDHVAARVKKAFTSKTSKPPSSNTPRR